MTEPTPSANPLLIVDDDPGLGKTLVGILRKTGQEAVWLPSGLEALRYMRESKTAVDIMLIDLLLPDKNGIELLREVKQINPEIGAIMITGHADIETALGALNEGAFAYIVKPYNVEEVKASIRRLREKQALVRENRRLLKNLQELNVELENKVRQRTSALTEANLKLADTIEELTQADKLKSEFVTTVSHELRTPLTVIIGCAQTLVNFAGQLDQDSLRKYCHMIDADAHRLARLADEILDLSQIQRHGVKLRFETFDLKSLTGHVVQGFRFADSSKQFELVFKEGETEIESDKDRMQQILTNLLGNAVKYTPEGGRIQVIASRQNAEMLIQVIDSGPGIPEDQRGRLFEPFFRTQELINFKHPGAGLGLAISKALVEALGGRIWLDPGTRTGSKFVLAIPLQRSNEIHQLAVA